MRDALIMALREEATDANGQMTTRLRLVASKLVDRAIDGDVAAIKEIGDRVDGRPPQAIVGDDTADPVRMITRIERVIVEAGK
ncbi:MAG: hypothetical protein IRY96_03695 [Burkholderiales bacterium]|nr:hypothetical protein [Burkholderiales bacterium]